ncbi:MAG: hypothetical protein M0P58_11030 [Bacteroidales bacterium]|nr:hypothetical protein [Bacteroidales bacterium]
MKLIRYVILCSLSLIPDFLFSQDLRFYREDLTFEIKNGFFKVDGIYNFCNNGNMEVHQVLFYPFPVDSLYGAVDSVNTFDYNTGSTNLILNQTDKGFLFKIGLEPYGTGKYRIAYRQKLLKNKAEYILVTTQKWNIPFENAVYKLIAPVEIRITSASYNPDSARQTNDRTTYYWTKMNFMPDKNMIFYFKQ